MPDLGQSATSQDYRKSCCRCGHPTVMWVNGQRPMCPACYALLTGTAVTQPSLGGKS